MEKEDEEEHGKNIYKKEKARLLFCQYMFCPNATTPTTIYFCLVPCV
jgi:hypothetical protein